MPAALRSAALRAAKGLLDACERAVLFAGRARRAGDYPPVFIIGAPRSGTTLLYQTLLARYAFAYFTNFAAQFPNAPIVASWLQKKLPSRPGPSDAFASDRGRTIGWTAPSEAGAFWYRWFPRGEEIYVPAGALPRRALDELAREVAGVSRVLRASALFKNVYNTLRVGPLLEAFPDASFVVCYRDPEATARSILKERVNTFRSKEPWWSLPPREIAEIKRHPYWEQVAEQVFFTCRQISRDREAFGEARFVDVRYEELCADVHGTLDRLGEFLRARGAAFGVRGEVPAHFPASLSPKVDASDAERIAAKVRELWT